MSQGKRGPNGGVIDIDDPVEVFPAGHPVQVQKAVREAFGLVVYAARMERQGYKANVGILLDKAAAKLTTALDKDQGRDGIA